MKSIIILTGLLLLLLHTTAVAQDDKGGSGTRFESNVSNKGTNAAAFLEIGVGARAEAMGGAYTAQYGNVEMLYWNPAGIAWIDGIKASFSHNEWLAETAHDFVGVVVPVRSIYSTIGLSIVTLGVPQQVVRTVEQPEGTGEFYDARDFALALSIGTKLMDKFSFGISGKYIQQRIWSESGTSMAVDAGVFYMTPLEGLRIGSSITNFGGDIRLTGRNLRTTVDPDPQNSNFDRVPVYYDTKAFPLPQTFRFGLAYEKQFGRNSIMTTADVMHPSNTTESLSFGAEYAYSNLLFLRAGYQNLLERDAQNGLTVGAGLKYKLRNRSEFIFDYAWSDWGVLKQSHRISLGFGF